MDENTHVYCTECIFGERLLNSILVMDNDAVPEQCGKCMPLNPEDSCRLKDRPGYVQRG